MWAVPSRKLNRWTESCLNFPTAAGLERLFAWGTEPRSAELALFVSPNRSLPHLCIISPRPFVVSQDRLLPTSESPLFRVNPHQLEGEHIYYHCSKLSASSPRSIGARDSTLSFIRSFHHLLLTQDSGEKISCQTTMLYRQTAARSVLRAISSSNASVARASLVNNVFKAQLTSSARSPARPSVSSSLALATRKPVTTALVRYASSSPNKVRKLLLGSLILWTIADQGYVPER